MYSANQAYQARSRYNLSPMLTQSNVYWALSNRRYTADPEYVKAVIRSYVYFKSERQKSKPEIHFKLEMLERDFPQFGYAFRAIRDEYSLPPSRILPAPRVTSDSNSLRRTQTATTAPTRPTTSAITRTHTTAGATTTRPVQANDDEPPPPPYASQDPEPEATRALQEQLAAEAEAAGSLVSEPPRTPATAASTSNLPVSAATLSPSALNQSTSSTTPQPTTTNQSPLSDQPPSDPELARIWEESQLVEAKRASIAWQREQEELQEAMRLSLAEAEANGQGSFGGDNEAGPSTRHITTVPEHAEDGPSTSATGGANADLEDLMREMEDMAIPSGWQAPLTPEKTGSHLKSKNPFLSPTEREYAQAEEEAGEGGIAGSGHTRYAPPVGPPVTSSFQQIPATPPSAAAGSSYTHYAPLTPQVATEHNNSPFAPPPGPPPAHIRIATTSPPTSPASRPLPVTPRDHATSAEPLSPQTQHPQSGSTPSSLPSIPSPLTYPSSVPRQPSSGPAPELPPRRSSFVPLKGKEDALEMLKEFDTVFLVDDSTSMAGDRWSQARQALMEVAEIAARYDENGVDIYFLNSKRVGKELKAAHEVEDLFRGLEPKGATPTGIRLEAILRDYMSRLERSQLASPGGSAGEAVKAMNLIVVTDGVFSRPVIHRMRQLASDPTLDRATLLESAPTDDPESVIIACAKRLDRGEFPLSQVGIQFLQIGDDSEAREALQELDDGLSSAHGVRDIVDTVLYEGEEMSAGLIIKTLLGGINRRLDRRSTA